jgi:hypothetical protein
VHAETPCSLLLLLFALCSFTQVRARKLAEAAAIVNELLLKASTLVSSALASDNAQPKDVQEVLAQVGGQLEGAAWLGYNAQRPGRQDLECFAFRGRLCALAQVWCTACLQGTSCMLAATCCTGKGCRELRQFCFRVG